MTRTESTEYIQGTQRCANNIYLPVPTVGTVIVCMCAPMMNIDSYQILPITCLSVCLSVCPVPILSLDRTNISTDRPL